MPGRGIYRIPPEEIPSGTTLQLSDFPEGTRFVVTALPCVCTECHEKTNFLIRPPESERLTDPEICPLCFLNRWTVAKLEGIAGNKVTLGGAVPAREFGEDGPEEYEN